LETTALGGNELERIMNPGTVTVWRIFRNASCQPRLPVTANVAVLGNSVHKEILPGLTSSKTRNPPKNGFRECGSLR
jgi:hypothetical protein